MGVAITYGPKGLAAGITASASKGKGHANSDDVVYSNTHVNAGNTVTIQSGGDTTLQGAVVSGKQVVADVGGNLNLESLQDTSTFSGKQQNIGGSVTVGAGFSGSVSYSKSKAKGDFASVNEQTGIQAGDGGFQVNVKGNTDLKGAVIASNQTAIDNNRNSLTTGTLTHSDIENHSDYKASGVNLSGGYSQSMGGGKSAGSPNTVGQGTTWSAQQFGTGVQGAAAGISSDSGNERSTTHSGISAGAVTITDEAGQQQKTGQSASEAAASIQSNVLTGDGSNGLQKNWDGQKLLQEQAANAQIMATFGQQASKAVGDYAEAQMKIAQQLRSQGKDAEADAINALWGDNGSLRLAAHTVVGGLTGGIGGAAAGNEVTNNYLTHNQAREKERKLASAETEDDKKKIIQEYAQLDEKQREEAGMCLVNDQCQSVFDKESLKSVLNELNTACSPPRYCTTEEKSSIQELNQFYANRESINPDTSLEEFLLVNKLIGSAFKGVVALYSKLVRGGADGLGGVVNSGTIPKLLFGNKYPEHVIDAAKIVPTERLSGISGNFNYVITQQGTLIVGRSGHTSLSGGAPVQAAGELQLYNGNVKWIDNASGHYQPSSSIGSLAETAFNKAGLDATSKFVPKVWVPNPTLPRGGAWVKTN